MRHRIDLDYEISADPWKRHRALYLLRPGVEMSGLYTCKVSTLENEVQSSRTMIVYTPPRLDIKVLFLNRSLLSILGI